MGRIRWEIQVDDRPRWALFDTGARHSYITQAASEGMELKPLAAPRRAALGGRSHEVRHVCLVFADIEGHRMEFQASVIDEIGKDEEDRPLDVLVGAIAMQLWGLRLDPQTEQLDFSHFATDFVEF